MRIMYLSSAHSIHCGDAGPTHLRKFITPSYLNGHEHTKKAMIQWHRYPVILESLSLWFSSYYFFNIYSIPSIWDVCCMLRFNGISYREPDNDSSTSVIYETILMHLKTHQIDSRYSEAPILNVPGDRNVDATQPTPRTIKQIIFNILTCNLLLLRFYSNETQFGDAKLRCEHFNVRRMTDSTQIIAHR